jgi:hypothetical protein
MCSFDLFKLITMTIKKLIYVLIISSLIFSSCKKFLDRPPLDTITDKEMSFSKTEIELYANQYYVNFSDFLSVFYGDNNSDNMIFGNFNNNPLLSGTQTLVVNGGGWEWSNIRSVNYFLANYKVTKEPLEEVNTYIGEVYFWRAWFYFGLMKQFGDLPWYNAPLATNSTSLYAPRISRSIIADSILADLDRAASLLDPVTKSVPQRIHKDVALAFKARVALYEGSWEKYHAGTPFGVTNADPAKYFKQASDAAEQIMNSSNYSISVGANPKRDYWNLFNQLDLSGNRDVIFWRKYDFSLRLTHNGQAYLLFEGGNTGISKQLVDDYLCADGLPISLSPFYKGDDSIAEVVTNRDPRLGQTIFVRGYPKVIHNGDTITKFSEPDINLSLDQRNTTGYELFKGAAPNIEPQGAGVGVAAGATTASIIFRYAEVLLIYAEANAELGTCTQEVLDASINRLRDKVAMPHLLQSVGFTDPKWDFPNLSGLINEIRRERRVELACENFRFDDLMRWAATNLIKTPLLGAKYNQFVDKVFNPPLSGIPVSADGYIFPYLNTTAANGWQFDPSKNYLSPIPTNELTINPSLVQNPGY